MTERAKEVEDRVNAVVKQFYPSGQLYPAFIADIAALCVEYWEEIRQKTLKEIAEGKSG